MCGIAGIWNRQGNPIAEGDLNLMVNKMAHRGPDAKGIWVNHNLGLGHSRLKILDLSDNANQPFTDGQDVLVFNGEIFNFKELKKELPISQNYKTTSDTEVLLKYLNMKSNSTLEDLDGMWSYSYFDKIKKKLFISRDRFGEKPLYYYFDGLKFYYGSNISYIFALMNKKTILNENKISFFLSYGPKSLFVDNNTWFANSKMAAEFLSTRYLLRACILKVYLSQAFTILSNSYPSEVQFKYAVVNIFLVIVWSPK